MTDETQQPDPFSELRGLMERASPHLTDGTASVMAVAGLIQRGYETQRPKARNAPHFIEDAELIVGAIRALPPLLDERDRLIGENERLRLIATDAALLGQVVASSYTPDHKPHTLKNPKTGDVVTGPIADAVIELVKIIIEQGNTARQALSQEIG